MGLTDVYAATIPTLDFQPAVHVNYAETVLYEDGLPKLRTFSRDGRFGRDGRGIKNIRISI